MPDPVITFNPGDVTLAPWESQLLGVNAVSPTISVAERRSPLAWALAPHQMIEYRNYQPPSGWRSDATWLRHGNSIWDYDYLGYLGVGDNQAVAMYYAAIVEYLDREAGRYPPTPPQWPSERLNALLADRDPYTYASYGSERPLDSTCYRNEWFDDINYQYNLYHSFAEFCRHEQAGDDPEGNVDVAMCRAIESEAWAMHAAFIRATTNNEGGDTMPEAVVEDIQIEAPASVRESVFESLRARESLMSRLDMENWQGVLEQLQQATQPILYQITRGGYRITEPRITVNGRRTSVEYVSLETAEKIVDVASDGKIRLIVHPTQRNANVGQFTLQPTNTIDARAFLNYAGLPIIESTADATGARQIKVRSLRNTMQFYADYRALDRRIFIRTAIRDNMRVKDEEKPVQLGFTREGSTKLGQFMDKIKSRVKVEVDPFKNIAILPHKTLSSRRWGIEIEHVDIYGVQTPKYWALHGDGSLRGRDYYEDSDSHGDYCSYWDDTDDCDCGLFEDQAQRGNRPSQTGEWNSPILHSFHSRGLKHLMDELEGRYTNDSAGVHVHVEAVDLTPEQIVRLTMIYSALEPLFIDEYHRDVRDYCKEVDLSELVNRFNVMRNLRTRQRTEATAFSVDDRYWTVNVNSLPSHGTIEFRAMGPVYEYEHLIRWAYLCREMVNIAKADVPQKAWASVHNFKDLIVLFSKYGKETPTPKWAPDESVDFAEVVGSLGIESRRAPNARPSNAHTSRGTPPIEVFDDYVGSVRLDIEPVRSLTGPSRF